MCGHCELFGKRCAETLLSFYCSSPYLLTESRHASLPECVGFVPTDNDTSSVILDTSSEILVHQLFPLF